ncbi:MAG: hypothetical protein RLO80_08000 [Hyphomonas sp.]
MRDLKTDLYVALRTAPDRAKRRYVSKGPLEGDAGTHDLVQIVFRVLESYTVELRNDLPPPVWPTTHK